VPGIVGFAPYVSFSVPMAVVRAWYRVSKRHIKCQPARLSGFARVNESMFRSVNRTVSFDFGLIDAQVE